MRTGKVLPHKSFQNEKKKKKNKKRLFLYWKPLMINEFKFHYGGIILIRRKNLQVVLVVKNCLLIQET